MTGLRGPARLSAVALADHVEQDQAVAGARQGERATQRGLDLAGRLDANADAAGRLGDRREVDGDVEVAQREAVVADRVAPRM